MLPETRPPMAAGNFHGSLGRVGRQKAQQARTRRNLREKVQPCYKPRQFEIFATLGYFLLIRMIKGVAAGLLDKTAKCRFYVDSRLHFELGVTSGPGRRGSNYCVSRTSIGFRLGCLIPFCAQRQGWREGTSEQVAFRWVLGDILAVM